jgi:hypothetical protein
MSEAPRQRRFALLGDGPLGPGLSDLLNQPGNELVATALRQSATLLSWHELLAADVDAVILTDAEPESLEAARQLVIHGKPLIVPFGPPLPDEFVAEMALYDAEGSATLIPLLRDACSPALSGELRRILAEGRLGEVVRIQLERTLVSGSEQPPCEIQESQLAAAQFIDVLALRRIGGNYSQVTVLRSGQTDTGFASQTLQLAGAGQPDATCVYRAVPPPTSGTTAGNRTPAWKLEITGSAATATLGVEDHVERLQIGSETITPDSPAPATVEQRFDVLRQPGATTWSDVARTYDTLEAMRRSLRRRRTIDLQFETTSERSQFKTHMATIGCGVIVWTMLGIIGLLLAGAVLDPRDGMQRQAEAAGFVLRGEAFEPDSATLTPAGVEQVERIGAGMGFNDAVVYIEATAAAGEPAGLDEQRREEVWSRLSAAGAEDPSRVVVRPLRGEWFSRVMQFARIVVFAPVALFLLFQLLLLITRPAAPQQSSPP